MADTPTAPVTAEDRPSGAFVSVKQDGVEIQSNTGTEEQLRSELGIDDAPAAEPEIKPRARSRHENPTTRMIEATRREATAKRERDEALAEAKRVSDELAALKAPKPPTPQAPVPESPPAPAPPIQPVAAAIPEDKEPTLDDFKAEGDPYTAWIFARNAWGTRQEIRKASQQTAQQWAAYHEAVAWDGVVEAAEKKTPGLKQKLLAATVGVDRRIMPYIRSQELGPDVLLYLEEHHEEAQRLTTLHPVDQIGQIGQIIGKLSNTRTEAASPKGSAPPPPPVSQARPPIKPPAGIANSSTSDEPPGDDASPEEYERYWKPRRKQYR